VLTEHLHDPPPAGTRTVFEMTVDCRIGSAGEALFDFANRLILAIPVVNRKLRAFLEIDDNGHRHPASADRAESRHIRADRGFWSLLGEIAAFNIPRPVPDGLSLTGGGKPQPQGRTDRTTAVSLPGNYAAIVTKVPHPGSIDGGASIAGRRQALCAKDGVKYASGEYRGGKLRRMRGGRPSYRNGLLRCQRHQFLDVARVCHV